MSTRTVYLHRELGRMPRMTDLITFGQEGWELCVLTDYRTVIYFLIKSETDPVKWEYKRDNVVNLQENLAKELKDGWIPILVGYGETYFKRKLVGGAEKITYPNGMDM